MEHSQGFIALVDAAKAVVKEMTIDQWQQSNQANYHLIDVREQDEWQKGYIPNARYLGKGIIERDIESQIPDKNQPLVLYCGGGFRSALAAENLQKMGYKEVYSLAGGIREWKEKSLPLNHP